MHLFPSCCHLFICMRNFLDTFQYLLNWTTVIVTLHEDLCASLWIPQLYLVHYSVDDYWQSENAHMLYMCQRIAQTAVITGQFDSSVYIVAPVAQMRKHFTKYNQSVPFWHFCSVIASRCTELLYDSVNVTNISKTIWLVENMYE